MWCGSAESYEFHNEEADWRSDCGSSDFGRYWVEPRMNKEWNERSAQKEKYEEKEEINQSRLLMAAVASKRPSVMREVIKGRRDSAWEQIRNHRNIRKVED